MIALRREVCWLLILALLCAWLPAVSRAEVSAIQVEGESVNGANFTPSIQLGTAYSGGKYLALFTDTQAPSEGYLMPYQFQAPAAGLYQLDVATTPPEANWTSPYDIQINDGAFERVQGAVEYGQLNSTVHKYHLNRVLLQEGTNTIVFRVKDRRTVPDQKYTFYMDSFTLTPSPITYPLTIEGEAATTNFAPGIQNGSAYSGGKMLWLFTDTQAPEGGYTAAYNVLIDQAGTYQLDLTSTPPNESWASHFDIKINEGAFNRVTNAVEYGQINSTVRQFHLDGVDLKAGLNTIVFRVTDRRAQPDQKYTMFIDSFSLSPAPLELKTLTTEAPLNVFQDGNPVKLGVQLTAMAQQGTEVAVDITDYWSSGTEHHTVTFPAGSKSADLTLTGLAKGHYRYTAQLTGSEQTVSGMFAVVSALSDRPALGDTPFGLDTAAAWLVPKSKMEDFASAMKLSGISWARDRMNWGDTVNPGPGAFNFAADSSDESTQALSDNGINVLMAYHSAPSWTTANGSKLPYNLFAAYDFARSAADYYGNRVDTWEMWNEPENPFTNTDETADEYAAFLKAAAIGYRDSAANPTLSVSGFALLPGNYENLLAQNDIFPYIDIYNFHRHQRNKPGVFPVPFPDGVAAHQAFLDQNGGGDKPMWVSEAGLAIASQAPNDITYEEQKAQARYLVTSTVTSLSQGSDKQFYFVAPPYQENSYYWGLFGRSFTPYAAYAAEAAMTEALGKGQYAGALQGLPNGVTGYAFHDGADSVLVLWGTSSTAVTLSLEQPQAVLTDFMGRKQTLTPAGDGSYSIPVGNDPVYVRIAGNVSVPLSGGSVSGTDSVPPATPLTAAERVVLVQRYPQEVSADSKKYGYTLAADQPTTVKVEAYNFNDVPMTGTIEGVAGGGWTLSETSKSVTIQPFEKAEVEFQVSAGPNVVPNLSSPISFQGTFGGQMTTKAVSDVRTVQDVPISQLVAGSADPASWRLDLPDAIASVGTGAITTGTDTGSVQFDYAFTNGDRWAYPYLILPAGTDYTGYEGLAFDIYADQALAGTTLRLFLKESTGSRYYTADGYSIKQGWNQIRIPFEEFTSFGGDDPNGQLDLNGLLSLQLGVNTTVNDLPPFTVKNLGVYD